MSNNIRDLSIESTGTALFNAILIRPLDLAPKLVYADWLEEHDNPLGKCLRDVTQCKANDFIDNNNPLKEYDAITLTEACRLVFPRINYIDNLTAKQSAMLPVFQDAWLRISTACGGYDLETVKSLIDEIYKIANLKPPEVIIELQSPLHATIVLGVLNSLGQLTYKIKNQIWDMDKIRNRVKNQIIEQVRDKIINTTVDNIWACIHAQIAKQISGQVVQQVLEQIQDKIRDKLGDKIQDKIWDAIKDYRNTKVRNIIERILNQRWTALYGLHDSGVLSSYSVFNAYGIKEAKQLTPFMKLATQIGWWWTFDNIVIITPRPQSIKIDDNNPIEISWPDFTVKDI